ncbi:MAG: cytochrome b [Hyphococcus sp.]
MRMNDSKLGYGPVSMLNHWVIGLSVICLIIFGLTSAGMEPGPERAQIAGLHKASGVLVLLLAVWRVAWRLRQGFPEPSPDHPAWQIQSAKWMHWFLMIAIILMPLSGLFWSLTAGRPVSMFGVFEIPAMAKAPGVAEALQTFHRGFSKVLIAGIAIHALAGVYHAATDTGKSGGRMFVPK